MSSRKRRTAEASPPKPSAAVSNEISVPRATAGKWWIWLAFAAVALVMAFEVYRPALNGEFLFDDDYLPFLVPEVQRAPLRAWLGVRPFLMVSYWWNYTNSGLEPYAYHAVSVVLHACNAVLMALVIRRLLRYAGEKGAHVDILAALAGGLFLLHPVNTESVAYVASRSEAMSVFFFLAAYGLFLYRRGDAVSIPRAVAILLLFGAACTVKEHTTVLPALLLLTDYVLVTPWSTLAIRRNAKLYVPIIVGGAFGLVAVWRVLSTAQTAGFASVVEFKWYQYLFTQFRVIWKYVTLYVLPTGLNGDYDYPVSHNIVEHGAIVGLGALVLVTWFAWKKRREYPLAAMGWATFLLLLAPTSSFIPIRDVIAERRMYLPFVGLLLITVEFLRRWRPNPALLATAGAVVLVACAAATHSRNAVWAGPLPFWTDVVQKAPRNARAQFQLAYAQWKTGNCEAAAKGYERVAQLQKPDDRLLIDWALALECLNKGDEAIAKLRQAGAGASTAMIEAQIGMIYGKRGRFDEALGALAEAERLDPSFLMTHVYRGNVYLAQGRGDAAIESYNRALAIDPDNEAALQAVAVARRNLPRAR